MLKYINYYILI